MPTVKARSPRIIARDTHAASHNRSGSFQGKHGRGGIQPR